MKKHILILSTSLRKNSNSEALGSGDVTVTFSVE